MSENVVTMVFTDLVNSTTVKKHLEGNDINARNRIYRDTILMPHRQRVEANLAAYGGRVVKTEGDAYFLVFGKAALAVQWAATVQISHTSDPIRTPLGSLQVRIGMHTGSPLPDGDDFIGQEVDYAARVAALANGGQILLSEVTAVFVRNAHIAGFSLHSHGDRELKGIGEVPIFELLYGNNQPQPLKEANQPTLGGIGSVIDWRGNCREMLTTHKRLTTNPLTAGDGLGFDLDEIYVPLGLVERKQQRRYKGDVSPEQGSLFYGGVEPVSTPDEITQKFQQDEFFEQILRPKRSKRIAIIGEPGAGKTTLLQKIAAWVLDNTEDVPIWISLADWQGKSLEEFLLQDWLKAATRRVRVTEAMEEALGELFNSGRVWLLLDAVDEMVDESGNALAKIANQLTGWVASARVVLTCRFNVWDAGKNALEAFDTYRNLDFSYGDAQTPDQVGQFIRSWFSGNVALAERLRIELDQPGRERIKDAVKNPLRLALLCRTWRRQQGGLPNTKAGLYQQFIEALYEWKQDRFPTSSFQRQELNKGLGKLGLQAIAQATTKFRLHHRLVCSVLGEPDEELFGLALQLGFLNQVGVAAEAENRGEKVYAFYHPTFQEYLAAQAIQDWRYFLNHTPHNPALGTYRIFEPQWKEVLLLWLGREDVPYEQKEELIQALVAFEDNWEDFYKYRAWFLAAASLAEFTESRHADALVMQLVKWGFGYSYSDQDVGTVANAIAETARSVLQESDRKRVIKSLIDLINTSQNRGIREQAVATLGEVGIGNSEAINALIELIDTSQEQRLRERAIESLGKIDPGNSHAIDALIDLLTNQSPLSLINLHTNQASLVSDEIFAIVAKVCIGNSKVIDTLRNLLYTHHKWIKCKAAEALGQIDPGNQDAINTLTDLLDSCENIDFEMRQAMSVIGKICVDNSKAINALIEFLHTSRDEGIRLVAAKTLGEIDSGNSETIDTLINLLDNYRDSLTRCGIVATLGEIGVGNSKAIETLIKLLHNRKSESELVREQTFASLGKIGIGNAEAIDALTELLHTSRNDQILYKVAETLGQIDPGNLKAINTLINLLHNSPNALLRHEVAKTLVQIAPENSEAINTLIDLLRTSPNEFTRKEVAASLKRILQGDFFQVVVSGLKDFKHYEPCHSLLWHCAQNTTYTAFYQAWHNQSTPTHPEALETTTVGSNPITQSLNLSELPQTLGAAICHDPILSQTVHLICIDGSQFIDRDNPAAEIYIEMVEQGCQERQQGEPTTMQALKVYWKQIKSDKRVVLVFYENPAGSQPQGFSHSFLTALSKFDEMIGVVTLPPDSLVNEKLSPLHCSLEGGNEGSGNESKSSYASCVYGEGIEGWGCLQFFWASQPQVVENILGWIRARLLEE